MSREKSLASIRRLAGREFDKALDRVCQRHRGLNFYTDEQLEEIREQMVTDARASQKFKNEQRHIYWARQTNSSAA